MSEQKETHQSNIINKLKLLYFSKSYNEVYP
jgi:hypothetical protein